MWAITTVTQDVVSVVLWVIAVGPKVSRSMRLTVMSQEQQGTMCPTPADQCVPILDDAHMVNLSQTTKTLDVLSAALLAIVVGHMTSVFGHTIPRRTALNQYIPRLLVVPSEA